jgi:hypothetical protein
MTERLAKARNGAPTAYLGNIALHSAYDPVAEADRFVASLEVAENVRFFILVEPCLGYLTASLRRRFPDARILALHCSPFFKSSALAAVADAEWNPEEPMEMATFLEDNLEDWEAAHAQVIEWRPAIAAYGEAARDTFHAIASFLKRAAANEATVRAFGRRWLRNAVRNSVNIERAITLISGDAPVVVAGAGPGLEEQTDEIARARACFPCPVIAVSSAVGALLFRGIIPDLVVTSDGGGWATFHLFDAARSRLPIAAALVAQLPSTLTSQPILTIADGSVWQRVLLASAGHPFVTAPQRGTVTATAIDLAMAATTGTVFVAGMDLASRDLRTHSRPYALDRFRECEASRFKPEYGAAYERSGMIRNSSALDIYASWFAGRDASYTGRLAALGAIHPALASIRHTDRIEEGGKLSLRMEGVHSENALGPRQRRSAAIGALLAALESGTGGGRLEKELTALLLGGPDPAHNAAHNAARDAKLKVLRDAVLNAAAGLS